MSNLTLVLASLQMVGLLGRLRFPLSETRSCKIVERRREGLRETGGDGGGDEMVEGREKWLFVPWGYLRSRKYGYRQLKLRDSGTKGGGEGDGRGYGGRGVRRRVRDATLRGKTKGVMMGRRSLHFELTLRPSARRSGGSVWWRAKRSRGRIYRPGEVRRCDPELLLWKSVVADNEDDEDEDEVGLDDRLDPVETIRYFPMASASPSFFDTSRFAHSHRLLRNKVSRHLRKIVSPDIARAVLNNL